MGVKSGEYASLVGRLREQSHFRRKVVRLHETRRGQGRAGEKPVDFGRLNPRAPHLPWRCQLNRRGELNACLGSPAISVNSMISGGGGGADRRIKRRRNEHGR